MSTPPGPGEASVAGRAPNPIAPMAVPAQAQPRSSPARPDTKAQPPGRSGESGGLGWLKSQPPGRYTLQLLGARDRAAIRRFARRHRIPQPWAVFERELDGRPWYSLVAGSYPDRAAAVAARARLPAAIARAGAWPRTFGSIQAEFQRP